MKYKDRSICWRIAQRVKGFFGARKWETLEEWEPTVHTHHLDGTISNRHCKARDQVCRITGRIRRQYDFGNGWSTENEV